jgi:hypothetical protein
MATTTNYGWTTPDDTALVKDGAAAIRTLGSSVDTTVFNNASAGIAKTIVDAKGDLIAGTASDTVARLAVGSNDQVLIADSTTATGLKWGSPSAGGMTLISTTTLTGASITLSSIPQTYNSLYVVIQNWRNATDGEQFWLRFNGDSTASRHAAFLTHGRSFSTVTENKIEILNGADNTVAQGMCVLDFPDYTNTTTHKNVDVFGYTSNENTTTTMQYGIFRGFYNQTSAITSLQFLPSNGNFTSGTVLLYGVK